MLRAFENKRSAILYIGMIVYWFENYGDPNRGTGHVRLLNVEVVFITLVDNTDEYMIQGYDPNQRFIRLLDSIFISNNSNLGFITLAP